MQSNTMVIPTFKNPLIRFISEPSFRWLRHSLFILLGLILAFKGDIGVANLNRSPQMQHAIVMVDIWTFLFVMAAIYFIMFFLIPRYLFRSKVFLFALIFFVIISLIYFVVLLLDIYYLLPADPGKNSPIGHIEFSLMHYIQISAVSTVLLGSVVGLTIFKKWINDVQIMNELQETNLRTELEQLKSQVNPHFLFNTLNNVIVLTKTDPEKASQVLLGLSDLLRYQLYDSAREKILLSKDIDFMQNLLALEKIRKNDFSYEIHTSGNINMVNLPPFLFIPFVENAIKHGASTVGHSYLLLNFTVSGQQLHFSAENSKPPVKKNSIGGIGLKNIYRRLELLYPGSHTLEVKEDNEKYIVNLILPL